MRASLTVLAAVLLAFAALTVSGCGLKGDLYLPENEAPEAPDESGEDAEETDDQASG